MKYSQAIYPLIILSIASLILGCSSRPDEQIGLTEKAREEAKGEYADQFALEDWSAAEKAWAEAEAALEAEDYRTATTALLRAKSRYTKARDIAQGQKDAMVKKVEGLKNTIKIRSDALMEGAGEMRLSASRKKDLEAVYQEFQDALQEITDKLDAGAFTDAENLAGRTLRKVWEAEQDFKK
jgi:hypothetical protein